MRHYPILFALLAISLLTCAHKPKDNENRTQIKLQTNKGNIILALYNETPLHRDNFIKLTKKKYFDGTLFHRVINDFMIQGGDPDSKNAKSGTFLGNGGPGYDIPAEIREGIIHKKGALAAAREGDATNPKRVSSGSQFYIVEGKVFTIMQLQNMEKSKNAKLRKELIVALKKKHRAQLDSLINLRKQTGDTIALNQFVAELNEKIDTSVKEKGFHFTKAQKEAYTTVGGVPHLDGAYTVFGEVLEGQDIVDKIAETQTNEQNRPIEDIVILKAQILK